ncbi:MAG: guanylate kinase [Muribaculaceae bacterium]|nr:guanylate kinase [Muribaculaceae bacterium]
MKGKIIILSAPSGTGKSTIINRLIKDDGLRLGFSISATSRAPRGAEVDGKDYFFLSDEEFQRRVEAGDFVEWEEVYAGTRYGTLESEVERVTGSGHNLIMDVDVKGALSIKNRFGDEALSIFVMPPNITTLEQRLRSRATDSEETISRRLAKAEYEMGFAERFDTVVVNDELEKAVKDVDSHIRMFCGLKDVKL